MIAFDGSVRSSARRSYIKLHDAQVFFRLGCPGRGGVVTLGCPSPMLCVAESAFGSAMFVHCPYDIVNATCVAWEYIARMIW